MRILCSSSVALQKALRSSPLLNRNDFFLFKVTNELMQMVFLQIPLMFLFKNYSTSEPFYDRCSFLRGFQKTRQHFSKTNSFQFEISRCWQFRHPAHFTFSIPLFFCRNIGTVCSKYEMTLTYIFLATGKVSELIHSITVKFTTIFWIRKCAEKNGLVLNFDGRRKWIARYVPFFSCLLLLCEWVPSEICLAD